VLSVTCNRTHTAPAQRENRLKDQPVSFSPEDDFIHQLAHEGLEIESPQYYILGFPNPLHHHQLRTVRLSTLQGSSFADVFASPEQNCSRSSLSWVHMPSPSSWQNEAPSLVHGHKIQPSGCVSKQSLPRATAPPEGVTMSLDFNVYPWYIVCRSRTLTCWPR
jgi:hypothetical protein